MQQNISQALQAVDFSYRQEFHDLDHTDPNWSMWYAQWLLNDSEISELLAPYFGENQLAHMLHRLDGKYTSHYADESWCNLFATEIAAHIEDQQ